jgi:hypothetical protein
MNILRARVNWRDGWDNHPNLELLVDKMPTIDILRYEEREDLFYAELNGYVSFYYYSQPANGFGGAVFNITMKDGSERMLKGPWSSRAGVANRLGFGPCLDVSMTDKLESYEKGYTFHAGHCSLDSIMEIVDEVEIGSGYGLNKPSWSNHKEFSFPEGSEFTLYREENESTGDVIYVPAVLFPDGNVWTKNEKVRD